jgi:hypothetical protein
MTPLHLIKTQTREVAIDHAIIALFGGACISAKA